MNKHILIFLLSLAFLAGCSGMRQIDCEAADWAAVGYEDGSSGTPASEIGGYQEACSNQGSIMDLTAYNSGHEEGVREYCKPENGFELGQNGAEYTLDCPADLSVAFLQEYIEGSRFYPYYRNINEREMTIISNRSTMGSLQASIGSTYVQMDSPGITHSQRNAMRLNIESMQSQLRNYELVNERLEAEISEWSSRLQEIKARYGR